MGLHECRRFWYMATDPIATTARFRVQKDRGGIQRSTAQSRVNELVAQPERRVGAVQTHWAVRVGSVLHGQVGARG